MTPEEQEAVRRALAATPPVGPMPPEVVARLEATIAELVAGRSAASTAAVPASSAVVADLEERRRRRWPKVLVAAASVTVLAYGVGAVLQDTGPQAETAMSEAGAGADEESRGAGRTDDGGAAPQALEPELNEAPALLAEGPVVRLREETLRRDVLGHLRDRRTATDAAGGAELDAAGRYPRSDGSCLLPEVGRGDTVVAARLDGRRATLVVRRAEAGVRVAQVYRCGDGRTLLAETEVPAGR